MASEPTWFTEEYMGLSFGLKLKAHLHQEKTPIMTIDIYDTEAFGHLMTIDGNTMVSTRENFLYHEMISHPALFTHPNPKRVIIIGGGDCGTLKEVLKHPVDSVIQIDIEEQVTRLSEKYFPELCTSNADPRATLRFEDGIAWMKNAPTNSADIIIIDSSEPEGPAAGLFNAAFYEDCYRVLAPQGVIALQSESPLLHQKILKDIQTALQTVGFGHRAILPFPQPIYPSGWWSVTLATKTLPLEDFRRDTAQLTQLNTQYYQFAIHEAALTPIPLLKQVLSA